MRWSKMLSLVDAHAEGEVGRVITGGVAGVPGATMLDKLRHLNEQDDRLRRFTLFEPRGNAQTSVNLLVPPTRPDADAAFIVMQADRCHAMSGSNAMCVVTVLLETGMLPMREPITKIALDTPAGLVMAEATCRDGRCQRVALQLVPSFVLHLDHAVEIAGYGTLAVDVAYGGDWFCMVDAARCGLAIRPDEARSMIELAERIKGAAHEQVVVRHPTMPELDTISFVMFCARPQSTGGPYRNGNVMYPGRMDRSPCGTGTAARLATMHARGEVGVGERLLMRSAIDSEFEATITDVAMVAGRPAVLPRISGRAWIYGLCQLGVDPEDPYQLGYTLPDAWGGGAA